MSEREELADNLEEPSEPESAAELEALVVDLNAATEEELSRLPGIGPVLATRIVDYREEVGPYEEPADIVSVPGITASMYDRLAGQLTAGVEELSGPESAAELEAFVVDLNAATEDELSQLPGIGPVLATRIVDYREEVGPYEEPLDIVSVPGITASMYDRLAGQLTAGVEELSGPESAADAEALVVDLNAATEEELSRLPGIGPVLAARIVDYREEVGPYEESADVVSVPGVTAILYERLAGQLIVGPVEPVPAAEPEEAEVEVETETLKLDEPAVPETEPPVSLEEDVLMVEPVPEAVEADELPEPVAEPPPLVVVSGEGSGGCWRLLVVGLLSAITGAFLSLAILLLINGTLNFQTATRQMLQAEVSRLQVEIGVLSDDLTGLRSRLEVMDELASQLGDAQAEIQRLAGDLATIQGDLEAMTGELEETQAALGTVTAALEETQATLGTVSDDVDELEGNVAALQTQFSAIEDQLNTLSGELDALRLAADRFETFLDGLRDLVERSARPTPEGSPFGQESPGPTPVQPTRQPVFTVIPLATPTPTP